MMILLQVQVFSRQALFQIASPVEEDIKNIHDLHAK